MPEADSLEGYLKQNFHTEIKRGALMNFLGFMTGIETPWRIYSIKQDLSPVEQTQLLIHGLGHILFGHLIREVIMPAEVLEMSEEDQRFFRRMASTKSIYEHIKRDRYINTPEERFEHDQADAFVQFVLDPSANTERHLKIMVELDEERQPSFGYLTYRAAEVRRLLSGNFLHNES